MNACQLIALIVGFAVPLTACNDQPTEPGPAELVIIQAPSTVGAPGWELIDTLIVRAVDPSGTPRAGVKVTWAVRQGGGSIAPTTDATDADGYARAVWTLGSTAGVNQVRASTVEGTQADFESTGEAFKVDQLASAWGMGCGLVSGAVWCWNFSGPGDPPSRNPGWGQLSRAPTLVDDTHEFIDLAVMGGAVCALDIQHTVWCARSGEQSLVLQSGLPLMRSIASSPDGFGFLSDELCGLAEADSTAWCWVYGGAGVQLPRSPAFIKLWMDPGIACGLRVDSTAACWGSGPLGDGTTGASDTAVAVSGGHRFLELALGVAVGSAGACGRTTTREIWCWGSSGSSPDVLTPIFLESNSYGVGMTDNVIASYSFGRSINQWWWLGATKSEMRVGMGLEDLPVKGFSTNNSPSCVHLVDRQVYCWDIMWDQTSRIPTETYSPVQPVRSLP